MTATFGDKGVALADQTVQVMNFFFSAGQSQCSKYSTISAFVSVPSNLSLSISHPLFAISLIIVALLTSATLSRSSPPSFSPSLPSYLFLSFFFGFQRARLSCPLRLLQMPYAPEQALVAGALEVS